MQVIVFSQGGVFTLKLKSGLLCLFLSHALTQNLMLRFILKLPSDLLSGIRERQACEQ